MRPPCRPGQRTLCSGASHGSPGILLMLGHLENQQLRGRVIRGRKHGNLAQRAAVLDAQIAMFQLTNHEDREQHL